MKRFTEFLSLIICIAILLPMLAVPMSAAAFPESTHPYKNNMSGIVTSYIYDGENADTVGGLKVHFTAETKTADVKDTISVYASGSRLVGFFSEDGLADRTLIIPGKAVYVSMTTDASRTAYGYKVDSIEPLWPVTYTFVTNGGAPLENISAAFLEKEPIPEKDGKFFAGWYDNPELSGKPAEFPYLGNGDSALYAAWSDEPYINLSDFEFEQSTVQGAASVFKYTGEREIVYLPTETADGTPVVEINSAAFEKSHALKVVINDKITKIDSFAFNNCPTLREIEVDKNNSVYASKDGLLYSKNMKTLHRVPCAYTDEFVMDAGVTALGTGVFDGCRYITSATVARNVSALPNFAFRNCVSLTEVSLPKGLDTIGEQAFYGCTALAEPKLPTGLTAIGKNAFTGSAVYNNDENWSNGMLCKDGCLLASDKSAVSGKVTIPDGILCIANNTFYQNTAITEVVLPQTLKTVCAYAFYGCSGITELKLPKMVKYVGDYAFAKCTGLKSVSTPAATSSIGKMGTFDGCTSLESVTLGYGIKALPVNAFKNCSKLKALTLTGNLKTVGSGAFNGCTSLSQLSFLGFESQWQAVKISSGNTALTSLVPEFSNKTPWIKGDINNDGKCNAADIQLMKRIIIGTYRVGELESYVADVNDDGKTNSVDSLLIVRIILGQM